MQTDTVQGKVLGISSPEQFTSDVLESPVPVLVDFYATWCGPCKRIAPILDQLAVSAGEQARIAQIDVDALSNLARQFNVMSVPTLIAFRRGREVERFVGAQPQDVLRRSLGL